MNYGLDSLKVGDNFVLLQPVVFDKTPRNS